MEVAKFVMIIVLLDRRFSVIHKENGGLSSARNAGMLHIRGEYTVFLDSDDCIDLNFLNKAVNLIKLYKSDIIQFQFTREKEKLGGEDSLSKGVLSAKDVYEDILVFNKMSSIVCGKLYQTSLIKNIRYNESCYVLEDVEFLTKIMQHASCYVDAFIGYYYRITPGSLITQGLTLRKLQGSLACQNSCISMLKDTSFKSRSYSFKYNSLFNWLIRTAKQKNWSVFYKTIKRETRHDMSHVLACRGISLKAKIILIANTICSPLVRLICK